MAQRKPTCPLCELPTQADDPEQLTCKCCFTCECYLCGMEDSKVPMPICAHCELPIAEDDDNPEQLICECYYCHVCDCHYTREDPCLYH